jgi:DNA polymerase III subunit delta'
MSFGNVLGHVQAVEKLRRAVRRDRIAHSYLFTGEEGIGRRWVALQFAKALNCLEPTVEPGESCDRCLSCKKIDGGIHPDVVLLQPEAQTLKVQQVRQMQNELAFRPYEGRKRVCIVTAADRMAPNMSNILLKTLEEPPLHTVIVLLAGHPGLILPTILSRCRLIRFTPLPLPSVRDWLMKNRGMSEADARLLAGLSGGSIGKALEKEEQAGKIPRAELLKDWVGAKAFTLEKMEKWVDILPSQREDLISILGVGIGLLRDLLLAKVMEDGSKSIHSDLVEEITGIKEQWSVLGLLHRMEEVSQTMLAVRSNANATLALEAMMLSWVKG